MLRSCSSRKLREAIVDVTNSFLSTIYDCRLPLIYSLHSALIKSVKKIGYRAVLLGLLTNCRFYARCSMPYSAIRYTFRSLLQQFVRQGFSDKNCPSAYRQPCVLRPRVEYTQQAG